MRLEAITIRYEAITVSWAGRHRFLAGGHHY